MWTAEQVIALSPDSSSTQNGKKLANVQKWANLGQTDQAIWGECQGSGKTPYRTQIDVTEPAFQCSCPSRKFPCKHGLGLFLLFVNQPAAFTAPEPPNWVETWLQKRAERHQTKAKKQAEPKDPLAQAKRVEKREAKVQAGIEELSLWLQDLVRQGLATVQNQPYSFWETPAARMVDAQASGLARQVRELASFPYLGQLASSSSSGSGSSSLASGSADLSLSTPWPERMLEHLGRLYLLLEGYQRLEELPPGTQADIRTLVGWTQNQEELLAAVSNSPAPDSMASNSPAPDSILTLHDRWLILGRRITEEEQLRVQRTWLWGEQSDRPALVLSFAHGKQPLDISLVPGTCLEAELVFFASAYPLRALVKTRHAAPTPITQPVGYATLHQALDAWTQALADHPWLDRFPLPLLTGTLLPQDQHWLIQDSRGTWVAIAPTCENLWEFYALSGGHPIGLFGEWDGKHFFPLSLVAEGRFWGGHHLGH